MTVIAYAPGQVLGVIASTPWPAPSFLVQPSVSPASGSTGQTFTATSGSVANGSITSSVWMLNGSPISSGPTATPNAAGSLTYQEFAGSVGSAVQSATVTAAASPFFGSTSQSWGENTTPLFGKAA